MKRPNITPETWEASDTSIIAGDICIAVIETDGGYEADPEVQKANARAIVAVPDLLAALERCLPCWHADDNPKLHDGKIAGEISIGDMRAVKAALTKAGYTF